MSHGAADRYQRVVSELCAAPGVSRSDKKGFGFSGLTVGGKLFATLRGEELLLKLPEERVSALIASGDGAPFDAGKGRAMKEWVLVKAGARQDWPALAKEAMAFVRSTNEAS